MASYDEILNAAMDEVAEPENVPEGTYRSGIVTAKFKAPKDDNSDPFIMFVYSPIEAQDDVDADQLAALEDLESERVFHRFYLADKRDYWNLNRHLDKFGVDYRGLTRQQALEEAVGNEALVTIEHSDRDDGEGVYVNATGFAPI